MAIEDTLSMLDKVLLRAPADMSHTADFREKSHAHLLEHLRARIGEALGDRASIVIYHSLQEAGCDIGISFRHSDLKYGVQVKSHGDIAGKDFARNTLAQIQDSRRHGLQRLYVLFAGDLTDRSQAQKVPGFVSRMSQMDDDYAVPIPPEHAWTLLYGPSIAVSKGRGLGMMNLPPKPHFAHHLGFGSHFTGRHNERQMLSEWLTREGTFANTSVLALVAIGGMGKSSVAWAWSRLDVTDEGLSGDPPTTTEATRVPGDCRPDGVLWWSFYEGDGTYQGFLARAIRYCSEGERTSDDYVSDTPQRTLNYGAIQEDLIQLLQRRRFLVIWDGAERLLREYGGAGAAMREERPLEELGPGARQAVLPAVTRFFRQMADQTSSRLLLSTRLYPEELEGQAGADMFALEGMAKKDAVTYLRALGILGNRAELETAAGYYDCHPQSLTNLAAALLEDFQHEADISAAPRHDQTESLKARQHHILKLAYERRAAHRRELLSRMAAMRGTIPKEVVGLLAENIQGFDVGGLGRDLAELVRLRLLKHPGPDLYDFHPIVRRYCYQRLESKEQVHAQLMEYYAEMPSPDEVKALDDLAPVIELYHHTVGAGLYDEARDLFRDRLAKPLYFQLGAYETSIELLSALFPGGKPFTESGEVALPRLKKEGDQAWTLNTLANSYSLSGRPRLAVPLFERQISIRQKQGVKKSVAIGLGNMADDQLKLGELEAAESNLRRTIELGREIEDERRQAIGHQELGRLLAYRGVFEEAATELSLALEAFTEQGQTQSQSVVCAHQALRHLLRKQAQSALEAARKARELAEEVARTLYPHERDFIRAEWLQGWAMVALAEANEGKRGEHLVEAERHLSEALTRCRRINMVDHEPDILLAWAKWHRLKGNPPEALNHANEALAIADRCEYRLKQADVHNFLARLAHDAGDKETTREHAEQARDYARCDGPPHYYKPAYEQAESLLEGRQL